MIGLSSANKRLVVALAAHDVIRCRQDAGDQIFQNKVVIFPIINDSFQASAANDTSTSFDMQFLCLNRFEEVRMLWSQGKCLCSHANLPLTRSWKIRLDLALLMADDFVSTFKNNLHKSERTHHFCLICKQ